MKTIDRDPWCSAGAGLRRLLSLALGCLVLASSASAQDLAAERARILTVIGTTKIVDLDLFPLEPGVGLAFRQEVVEPTAESLRIHFLIRRSGEAWGVQVKDETGAVRWSTWDGAVSGDGFWSDEIPGKRAIIEIHSSKPANLLQLQIDRIAIGTAEVTPVSITFPNQLTSINGQEDWIVTAGRSVARLRFVGDGGSVFVCTAFLVTPDIMLTNQHCIATVSEMESALVDFDFDNPGEPGLTLRLSELLDQDFALDYSVIRLSQCVGRAPLRLDATAPDDGEQLLVVQHPGGEPKQVSLADCRVDGALVTGRGGTPTDFGHECDTMGGSSGSPAFDFDRRTVVGLHHLGITPGSSNLFNRASHIGLVLEDMDPVVRAEIEAGQ